MQSSTLDSNLASARPKNVLRIKRPRLSLNHPSKLKNVRFPLVGSCLARKLAAKDYSPYDVQCPLCSSPPRHKCVGARGTIRPIPHIPRELRAAESYRQRILSLGGEGQGGKAGTGDPLLLHRFPPQSSFHLRTDENTLRLEKQLAIAGGRP
jgi:hypothetical protein